jgi:hypothetical protein
LPSLNCAVPNTLRQFVEAEPAKRLSWPGGIRSNCGWRQYRLYSGVLRPPHICRLWNGRGSRTRNLGSSDSRNVRSRL